VSAAAAPSAGSRVATIAGGVLAAGYPILVYVGLRWLEPRAMALLIGATMLLRAALRWHRPTPAELLRLATPALAIAAVLGTAYAANDEQTLLWVPGLVNGALLFAFARTLRRGTPMVETFARLRDPDLNPAEVRYCRSVTVVWCVFFAANAAVCFYLAWTAPLWVWTLYTGVLSYAAVGGLFAVEFVVRSWRFQRYRGSVVEPLFRRIFPPPG